MIFTERKITVRKGKSSIDEPVILYRGDYEVELRFTIMESKYRFKSGVNLVDSEKASHAQLALLAPDGTNVFTEVGRCEDGTAIFVLSKEMIDELSEVGLYSFQIRLFDYYRESRITIPPIEFGIEVREPIAAEDHTNAVDDAMVGYSIAKTSLVDSPVGPTFDDKGQYVKTDWETGDRISEGRLNKIEDALHQINQNEMNDVVALDRRITSNYNTLDSTKANKNEIFSMKNMGQDIKEAMTGGSVPVVGKNSILNENIVDGQISPSKLSFISKHEVDVFNPDTITPNSYVSTSNGRLGSHDKYATSDYFRVSAGDVITIPVAGPASLAAFYDVNYNFISGKTGVVTDEVYQYSFTVPANANIAYCRLSLRLDLVSIGSYYIMNSGGYRLDHDITLSPGTVKPDTTTFMDSDYVNVLEGMAFTPRTFVNSEGTLTSHATYGSTDYIPVYPGQRLLLPIHSPMALGACYDANYNFIGQISGINTSELKPVTITVPNNNNVAFCRLSMRLDLLPFDEYYVKTDVFRLGPEIKLAKGTVLSDNIASSQIEARHLKPGTIVNDRQLSSSTAFSSSRINDYLYGFTDSSKMEWSRSELNVYDFESIVQVGNIVQGAGSLSFTNDGTHTWGFMYTTAEEFEIEAINTTGTFYLVYNVNEDAGSLNFMLLNGSDKTREGRGPSYTLNDWTKSSVIKDSNFLPEVSDAWLNTPYDTTVFITKKEGDTMIISISDDVATTEVARFTGANAIGLLVGANVINYIGCKKSNYAAKVTYPGIMQNIDTMKNDIVTLKAGGASGDLSSARFAGTKILVAGDSITEANFRCNKNWHGFLKDWLQLSSVYNEAKSGTGLVRPNSTGIISRLHNWPNDDYSMILLMGNMNDYSGDCSITYNVGTFDDQDDSMKDVSLYGALHYTCKHIIEKYPTTSVGWIISTPRKYTDSSVKLLYGKESLFEQATVAIKEVCGHYGIPVLDLYHESGLRPWLPENNKMYFSCASAPNGDGVHPNDAGQELMARRIYEFVKQYM